MMVASDNDSVAATCAAVLPVAAQLRHSRSRAVSTGTTAWPAARGRSLRAFLDDAADSAVGVAGDQLALGERCDDLALGLDSAYTFDEADRGPVPDRSVHRVGDAGHEAELPCALK